MSSTHDDDGQILSRPLTLPSGAVIKNRLGKSAMSEALGTIDNHPTDALPTLYDRWARGGIGLCITGNVMIDKRALGEPKNVVIEGEDDLQMLRRWAKAGSADGTQLWMQINHPGKQSPKGLNAETVSPSAVPFGSKLERFFDTPRELTEAEIEDIIGRYGRTAAVAREAGFGGVQIHGAHGYLVSQFLSPHHNRRTDDWGGTAEKRRHFVMEVYREMRRLVGDDFPVGIKLNSADFQRGGFTEEESLAVIEALDDAGIDLIEVSGGTYEAPAMSGPRRKKGAAKESTLAREAYFIEFAEKVREHVKTLLMVTGGFRSSTGMADALRSGALDLVGLARPLAIDPEFPRAVLSGREVVSQVSPRTTGIKVLDKAAILEVSWYERQLKLMGRGEDPRPEEDVRIAFAKILLSAGFNVFKTRRARA